MVKVVVVHGTNSGHGVKHTGGGGGGIGRS